MGEDKMEDEEKGYGKEIRERCREDGEDIVEGVMEKIREKEK